jgi:predicted flavoprotein YhiN
MKPQIKAKNKVSLKDRLNDVDKEFKEFLSELTYKKEVGGEKLKTFSPLDAVSSFEKRGLQSIEEVSRDEMFNNNRAMNKILANMLNQCQPGSLSEEDYTQISGINGREVASAY